MGAQLQGPIGWDDMSQSIEYARVGRVQYIHDMLAEMQVMAEAEHCDMVAYFIEMASTECREILNSLDSDPVSTKSGGS